MRAYGSTSGNGSRRMGGGRALGVVLVAALLAPSQGPVVSAQQQADSKPYDDKLTRLAEILGAVHFLRELCGSTDGQLWRDRMREIIDGEGATALRKAKRTRSFNAGYRSYSRTYQTCTPTAQTAISRFLAEGVQIADGLIKTVP